MRNISIIIPANNEAKYIGPCLDALLAQKDVRMQIIVSANACTDGTVDIAQRQVGAFESSGHKLHVLDSPLPGKIGALERAEAAIAANVADLPRVYLDADVICDPDLIGQIAQALDVAQPRYATGTLQIAPAQSPVTRAYARFWSQLPFVKGGAVGAGCFALNAAGRARWGAFPQIISDDTFVRINFTPEERIEVSARYHWPMIEGFRGLVKVRRRQDAGVEELHDLYPSLLANERKIPLTRARLLSLACRQPVDFLVYMAVHMAVRLGPKSQGWTRGR